MKKEIRLVLVAVTLTLISSIGIVVYTYSRYSPEYLKYRILAAIDCELTNDSMRCPYNNDSQVTQYIIESFLLTTEADSYYRSRGSEFFCAANVRWEDAISESEKVVYAKTECASILYENGQIQNESGGVGPEYFLLEEINDEWKVVDVDNRRVNPDKEEITQEWIRDVLSL